MNKKITGGLIALISGLVLLVAVPTAAAGDNNCPTGTLTGPIDGNVVVLPGASCFISGATINGNVKALENSQLTIIDSTVRGNVEGDKADVVQILDTFAPGASLIGGNFEAKEGNFFARVCGTTLAGGNIQVEKFRPDATNVNTYVLIGGPSFCGFLGGGNTLLKGNIKVEENMVAGFGELHVDQNSVAANLQVFRNTGPTTKTVQNNTVGESIQCKENSLPFIGGPNTAPKKEDQCF